MPTPFVHSCLLKSSYTLLVRRPTDKPRSAWEQYPPSQFFFVFTHALTQSSYFYTLLPRVPWEPLFLSMNILNQTVLPFTVVRPYIHSSRSHLGHKNINTTDGVRGAYPSHDHPIVRTYPYYGTVFSPRLSCIVRAKFIAKLVVHKPHVEATGKPVTWLQG